MTDETLNALVARIEEQIVRFSLTSFKILFHGGEPMLYAPNKLTALLLRLDEIGARVGCAFGYSITTNGALIDASWVTLFERFRVRVTISVDGPSEVHDARRVDRQGRGTHHQAIAAIEQLRQSNVSFGILAVSRPDDDPIKVVRHFVDDLGIDEFNILIPDATHQDSPPSIARYYNELFDYVYFTRKDRRIKIHFFTNALIGLIGLETRTESIGVGPINTVTVLTDGELQPLDVVRIAGDAFTRTNITLFNSSLEGLKNDPLWQELYNAGLNHPVVCRNCDWYNACGGGHISSRWSVENRFHNPSVYCADFKQIFSHVWDHVERRIAIHPESTT